jgi:lysophospholipase L1-like esterase
MKYNRFIVLGDSFSEGMCDEKVNGEYRGWADRVADVMAEGNPDFTYANLAIRGKLLQQVIDDQIPAAKKFVTGKDTLISFHAGANDGLRPNYNPELAKQRYHDAVAELTATGASLMLFTVLDRVDAKGKTADLWHKRFSDFNIDVRETAKKYGAILNEAQDAPWLADRRFIHTDRLHLNAKGHWRLAQSVLEKLGYPFDESWRIPLPPDLPKPKLKRISENTIWIITFVIPWIWRRARGKSSGDGRSSKQATPIKWS